MRSTHLFNHDWLYTPQEVDTTHPDSDFETVVIPHNNIDLPWHNFDDKEYQFISTYRKRFTLPEALNGRRVYLDFEGVMQATTVTINWHTFEEHKGGFVPFSYDITDYLNEEGENLLQVRVDSHERKDIPPHGGTVDYLVFGGIYRDVHLRYVNPVHITNVRVKTFDVLTDNPRVEVDVWVKNQSDDVELIHLTAAAMNSKFSNPVFQSEVINLEISPMSTEKTTLSLGIKDVEALKDNFKLWDIDNPSMNGWQVHLIDEAKEKYIDFEFGNFGFREAEFRDDGFYLNDEKVFLRGLNRHQMYPFVGMAAGQRLQARDADIIKQMGCNIVRCSHYPQSKYFLDRCDEIGLLVFEEIPGWQHIGNEDWKQISLRDVRAMIERDWNHPSIVVWGVRINESWDDADFYTRTNQLARELDPTRQTTGVRFFPTSEFLEDVYGFNDFTNGVLEPMESPWLITEYNGHMFPTKTFDSEERQHEHVQRHARIQSMAMSTGGVSGAIGWCAFDYNTHLDFGSGDRVCYHGVMDMWRQPKWAAYVYRSQKSREEEIVMEIASFWTMGDRSEGGNDPFYVLTNLDAVDVYIGDDHLGRYEPAHGEFPNLPHPPIRVERLPLLWGGKFKTLRVVGLVDGEQVMEKFIEDDSIPRQLEFYAEDEQLTADGMDMTRLVFKITDKYGNRLPYAIQPVHFELLEGDVQLIGENPFALVGGQAAMFLRANQTKGTVRIKASTPRLEPVEINVELV
ncbi:MAG: glycoside hydrolase family 2 TIM barrel-domain containing protein [Chloroflexota bacterium]